MQFLNIAVLAAAHPWVHQGWTALVDNYREHQATVRQHQSTHLRHPDITASQRAYLAAAEVLTRQLADLTGVDRDTASISVRGQLIRECGRPDNPKGLDEWNTSTETRGAPR